MFCMVVGICNQDMGEIVFGIVQYVCYVVDVFVVEKGVWYVVDVFYVIVVE